MGMFFENNYYDKLCDLLEANLWEEADQETFKILLKLMSIEKLSFREELRLLTTEKVSPKVWISKIDYKDLKILNDVWMRNSDGHFGFEIQNQIYIQSDSLEDFYQTVGWEDAWEDDLKLKSYDELTFSLDSPEGHLPGFWLRPDFPYHPNEAIEDWLPVFFNRFPH